MPTVASAVRILEETTDVPASKIRAVARQLIDDGLLPKSSGRRIETITPHHMAQLFFAIYAASTVRDSTRVATLYNDLFIEGGGPAASAMASIYGATAGDCFARVLDSFISGELDGGDIRNTRVEICLTVPEARFINTNFSSFGLGFAKDGEIRYFQLGRDPEDVYMERPAVFVQIPAATFDCIAQEWRFWDKVDESNDSDAHAQRPRAEQRASAALWKRQDSARSRQPIHPDAIAAFEAEVMARLNVCFDLDGLEEVWRAGVGKRLREIGSVDKAAQHRITGLFALKRAEIIKRDEDAQGKQGNSAA